MEESRRCDRFLKRRNHQNPANQSLVFISRASPIHNQNTISDASSSPSMPKTRNDKLYSHWTLFKAKTKTPVTRKVYVFWLQTDFERTSTHASIAAKFWLKMLRPSNNTYNFAKRTLRRPLRRRFKTLTRSPLRQSQIHFKTAKV